MSLKTKYAPQNLTEIIYPTDAVRRRVMAYASGNLTGNILFYGPNGTGKTSTADLIPYAIAGKQAYVEKKSVDELAAMSDFKLYIQNIVNFLKLSDSGKYFLVIHEMDNLKGRADKLWTAMDDVKDDAMLILTTNEQQNIHKSIRSRCKLIEYPAISAAAFLPRAQHILKAENVDLKDDYVRQQLAEYEHLGDMRRFMEVIEELIFINKSAAPPPGINLSIVK